MAQRKHNPEAFSPPSKHAEIIPFRARSGEALEITEQNAAQFYVEKWVTSDQVGQTLAETILADTDTVGEADDEIHARLKEAMRTSPLYDHYDRIHGADTIIGSISSRFLSNVGEGLTPVRKAHLALMDVRATEIIQSPDQDIEEQLAKLPMGDEERWVELLKRL